MKNIKNEGNQEVLIKDMQLMIASVKAFYEIRDERITMEEMSVRMDRGKKFLTHITNGNQPIKYDHIILFREYFKNELPFGFLGQPELKNITTTFDVIIRELSKIQFRIDGSEDPSTFSERLKKEIADVLVQSTDPRIVS